MAELQTLFLDTVAKIRFSWSCKENARNSGVLRKVFFLMVALMVEEKEKRKRFRREVGLTVLRGGPGNNGSNELW